MSRRWIAGLIVAGALAVPAQASAVGTDVFLGSGDLNVHAQSGSGMAGFQVSYQAGPDEWQVLGDGATAGGGCTQNGTNNVTCPENGEDVDVEFANLGGSITFAVADSFLDFDTDIELGTASDTVTGTDGVDTIHYDGSAGSTTGGDNISAGAEDDDIDDDGQSSDIINGGDGTDTIVAGSGNNILNGGDFAGDDTDGADVITGGSIQDDIDGGAGGDTLNGGDDDDEITGGNGDDIINAGPGDDGASVHVIDGEDGNDTINGQDGADVLEGGADTDTLNGGNQNDTLDGGEDTDTLHGDANDDTLLNSNGPDTFDGGANGTAGDEVDYSPTSGSAILADIDGNADDGRGCPGTCENDNVQTTVENLTGDSTADTLIGSTQANVLDGGGGNDTLAGGQAAGADGGDRFNDTSGTDTVTYNPTPGTARTGNLTVDIDGAADDGTTGENDEVETNIENVVGGSGTDSITGSTAVNDLRGGPGTAADTLSGGSANDTLFGGIGTNTGSDGADVFNGDAHTTGDTVSYAGRTDAITANLDGNANDGAAGENDDINTTVENLTGGSGNDNLTGNTSSNVLDGSGGNDTLKGGTTATTDGTDSLIGNTGTSDTADYSARSVDLDLDLDGTADDGDGTEDDTIASSVENLTGGSGDDDMTGNTAANKFTGNGGDDDLISGTATGADGTDVYDGGASGTAGGQNGANGDFADLRARDDNLAIDLDGTADDGGGGCPAGGGCEDDNVTATVERVSTGDGDDTLIGNNLNNILNGGAGDDLIQGGAGTGPDGSDSMVGGNLGETNGDTISYANRTDDIVASPEIGGANGGGGCPFGAGCEDDSIDQSAENLTGGSGNDTLSGDASDNRISGGAGNDTMAGSLETGPDGADQFLAGAPVSSTTDTVTYAKRADDIDASIGGGADDVDGDNISSDVDNLIGGSADDDLTGDGDPNTLDGGAGDDDFVSGTSTGPDGADVYIGGSDNTPGGQNAQNHDRVFMTDRLDDLSLDIGGGADDSDGDNIGDDVETLVGGEGDDVLVGDGDANSIDGREGDDVVSGGQGTGPDGADILTGGTDGVLGDTVSYATRTDNLTVDLQVTAGPDGDTVQASIENVTGGSGGDTLTGDANPNAVEGGLGGDDLFGLAGADTMRSADGVADDVDCGTEADTAVVDAGGLDNLTDCETLDTTPETTITRHPQSRTRQRRATFKFEADEAATFECKLDSGDFEPCTSPKEFTGLERRRHTFKVQATDLTGNKELKPAKFRWRIEN